jgi:4-alpha-glucanotransferase
MSAELIERLARLRGIGDAYYDYRQELRHFSVATKTAILGAMHCAVDDPRELARAIEEIDDARWGSLLPGVMAVRAIEPQVAIALAEDAGDVVLRWSIRLEHGGVVTGEAAAHSLPQIERGERAGRPWSRRGLKLTNELPHGYHQMELVAADGTMARGRLIVAPPKCFEPEPLRSGARAWGLIVQLYTLRSASNWGIGDFSDLATVVRAAAAQGAGFVGLNPLHSLFPADPVNCSPYSASSRHALNVLLIDVPGVEDVRESKAVQRRLGARSFRERLERARATHYIDYAAVAALKFEALEAAYRHFRKVHLGQDTARARAFHEFLAAQGEPLRLHALFDALDTHLRATHGTHSGWQNWPPEFRSPASDAVQRFAQQHGPRIEYFCYLQWLASEQLRAAQRLALALGMPIGLYADYAVGVSSSGSETWSDQRVYCMGAAIGAPPDALALKGQDWGLPPQDPRALQDKAHEPFIGLVRTSMRTSGALRLDHVMSLFRQWWVPRGLESTQGGYVHYPLDELMAILALESERNQCLVVGEDLGVVPDEMRHAMHDYAVYHYKVFLFEKADGRCRSPDAYMRRALATVTTHDLPTLKAWWSGEDIDLRERLNLYPGGEAVARVRAERAEDRALVLQALELEGLRPAQTSDVGAPYSDSLALAVHVYLARSNAALVAVQIEDLIGMTEPINVPGTSAEFPNWQRKMSADIEDIFARAAVRELLAAVQRSRDAGGRAAGGA